MDKLTLGIKLLKKSERLLDDASLKGIIEKQIKEKRTNSLMDEMNPLYNWLLLAHMFYYLHNKKIFRKHYKKYTFYKELKRNNILYDDRDIKQIKQYFKIEILESLFEDLKKHKHNKVQDFINKKKNNKNISAFESKNSITELLNTHEKFITNIRDHIGIYKRSIDIYYDTHLYNCTLFKIGKSSSWSLYCRNKNTSSCLYEFLIK